MNDDLMPTNPRSLGEQAVAVHSQRFDERKTRIGRILIEPAAARQQLATARRAWLQVATRVVPATTEGTAVAAPVSPRSPARFVTERKHVEATPFPMEGIDNARDGLCHLAVAPTADGHQATFQSERSSGNCR